MSGSTKLWLAVYIVLSVGSWYMQYHLLQNYGGHKFTAEGAPAWIFWLMPNGIGLIYTLRCIWGCSTPNVHAMWNVILAPAGVITAAIAHYLFKGIRSAYTYATNLFRAINAAADKHLEI